MISSVGAIIGEKEYDVGFHVTTPSPWALQRFLRKEVGLRSLRQFGDSWDRQGSHHPLNDSSIARGPVASLPPASAPLVSLRAERVRAVGSPSSGATPRFLVLETTSHAIDQNRIWGIPFDIGVLTNVTHEHLDYHKTYENYVKTKAKLLKMSRVAIINRDDESYELVKSKVNSALQNQKSKLQLKSQKLITYGMTDSSDVNPQAFPFKTNLIGEFNKYNVLAAVAACRELGISDQLIREAILTFKPPIGREEIVYKNPFTVMIDFAHTPNAYDAILSSIRPSIKRRLIHVFGAAGLRDASKRPLMGKASAKYSDIIILTAEDPRSESVGKIMEEIVGGIDDRRWKVENGGRRLKIENRIFKIADRQEAITAAIGMAKKGDFVLITGKSHEKSMNYGKGEEPWDEFGAVSQALKERRDEK
jgi:UDP-N-acetylmuramoyl-L-alanyl-D-glutamate--2,6-diaminopimelate ligase